MPAGRFYKIVRNLDKSFLGKFDIIYTLITRGAVELYQINVRMRRLGKKNQAAVEPVAFLLDYQPETVKDLIVALVCLGVREFNERKDVGQIVPWLTKSEIENRASSGKVSFGLREGRDAEEKQAAENALQCFEDGIYRIFAGTEELTDLNQPIIWDDSLEFTFVRLTMLSGW